MDAKKLNDLLDEIEDSLGHYSPVGGIEPPYIKTDDKIIRKSVNQIREGMKSVGKDIFVTNEESKEPVPPPCTDEYESSITNETSTNDCKVQTESQKFIAD